MIIKVKTDKKTKIVFNFNFKNIGKIAKNYSKLVLIIDANVYKLHKSKFKDAENVILIEGGEDNKTLEKSQEIINQLLKFGVDRKSLIIGIGGGVITDLVGFVSSIFKRGISFGFIPTTVLCAVDSAIGGKNGVNNGTIKNCIGTINQPDFILYDYSFYTSLSREEFANGFAEIIKYGCICDKELFEYLESKDLEYFIKAPVALQMIIQKSLHIKTKIILKDPNDNSIRKTLNFGHTIGHAIEKDLNLKHGYAISLGMVFAAQLSTSKFDLDLKSAARISDLLLKYELPIEANMNVATVLGLISDDKKKTGQTLDFILLRELGISEIVQIPIEDIKKDFKKTLNETDSLSFA